MSQKSLVRKILDSPWASFIGFHRVHKQNFDDGEYTPMKVIKDPKIYILNLYYHLGCYILLTAAITYTITGLSSNH